MRQEIYFSVQTFNCVLLSVQSPDARFWVCFPSLLAESLSVAFSVFEASSAGIITNGLLVFSFPVPRRPLWLWQLQRGGKNTIWHFQQREMVREGFQEHTFKNVVVAALATLCLSRPCGGWQGSTVKLISSWWRGFVTAGRPGWWNLVIAAGVGVCVCEDAEHEWLFFASLL